MYGLYCTYDLGGRTIRDQPQPFLMQEVAKDGEGPTLTPVKTSTHMLEINDNTTFGTSSMGGHSHAIALYARDRHLCGITPP